MLAVSSLDSVLLQWCLTLVLVTNFERDGSEMTRYGQLVDLD